MGRSNLPLLLSIARTHLVSRKRQTIVAALGVTFGIAMFVLMISFMTGVNNLIEDMLLSAAPHIRVYNDTRLAQAPLIADVDSFRQATILLRHPRPPRKQIKLKDGLSMLEAIRADPRVYGASPLVSSQVFFNNTGQPIPGNLAGVDIRAEDRLFDLSSKMVEGTLDNLLTSSDGVLMGVGLARKMGLHKGERVSITTAEGVQITVKIVGLFQTGITAIDDARCYTQLHTVQKALRRDRSYITDINLKLHNALDAPAVAQEYQRRFGFRAEDWQTTNSSILVSFTFRNILTYVVSITLLVVAGFGIYNIMNMTIYEKMRDIAILKATGFSGRDVVSIFLLQALIIGLMGGIAGVGLGALLSYLLSLVPFESNSVLQIESLPVTWDIRYYLFGLLFGLSTTALAGWFPSRKAASIDPVEIIRGK